VADPPAIADPCTFTVATAPAPGAVAIIQLQGPPAADIAEQLTGKQPDRFARLVRFADIDEGLAFALRRDWVQLMPHGGPRVVQRLTDRLRDLGATPADAIDPLTMYPEARNPLEAHMLAALAHAASPAAIDRLLAQPAIWQKAASAKTVSGTVMADSPLDHLITPPTVVLVGRANVGKSTLTNFVTGRATSITADLPGTTRDWVGGLAMLPTPVGELCVRWFDTPGLRDTHDPIEQRAIQLARPLIESADLLIAVADPQHPRPDETALPRTPDLHVINKADRLTHAPPADAVPTTATTGQGLDDLAAAIAHRLGLRDIPPDHPWPFCQPLRQAVADDDAQAIADLLAT